MCPSKPSAESKICELYMPVCVYEDIIRFYIPVNKTHFMNTVHSTNQLTDVKPK